MRIVEQVSLSRPTHITRPIGILSNTPIAYCAWLVITSFQTYIYVNTKIIMDVGAIHFSCRYYDLNLVVCTRYRNGSINVAAFSFKILLAEQSVKLCVGLMLDIND